MATKNEKSVITEKPVWFITGCSLVFRLFEDDLYNNLGLVKEREVI